MTIGDFERRFMDHTPVLMDVRAHYAVLVPLVEWQGEPYLLLEVRAETLNRQPGEVCFPGGRMEPGEGPTQCAFRETREELGIPASAIRPIARLDELHHRDGALLHPVLAQVDAGAVVHMSASHAEVKETVLAPVRFFRENPPQVYHYPLRAEVGEDFPYHLIGFDRGYRWRAGGMEVPIWSYRGHAVWGLTARIIKHLMEQLAEGEESNTPPVAAP